MLMQSVDLFVSAFLTYLASSYSTLKLTIKCQSLQVAKYPHNFCSSIECMCVPLMFAHSPRPPPLKHQIEPPLSFYILLDLTCSHV